MAGVEVTMKAAVTPRAQLRKRVTLANRAGTLTLSSTNPESELANLGSKWAQTDRPRQDPLLRRVAPQLREVRLQARLYDYYHRDAQVAGLLVRLRQIINSDEPVRVVYGLTDSGLWAFTDASARVERRAPGTNHETRIALSATLTEVRGYSGSVLATPRPKTPSAAPAAAPQGVWRPVTHVVKAGDTLSSIAVRYGGDADDALTIARANKLSSLRVPAGVKLTIPEL